MILTVRPATLTDASRIGETLRAEDRMECETMTGMAAQAAVLSSFQTSKRCYTIRRPDATGRIEKDPCVIFGVLDDPQTEGVGVMWMLCSDRISGAALSILREMRFWIAGCIGLYPKGIHNLVDKRNDTHLRWLQVLGFTLHQEVEVNGQPFVHAVLRGS